MDSQPAKFGGGLHYSLSLWDPEGEGARTAKPQLWVIERNGR